LSLAGWFEISLTLALVLAAAYPIGALVADLIDNRKTFVSEPATSRCCDTIRLDKYIAGNLADRQPDGSSPTFLGVIAVIRLFQYLPVLALEIRSPSNSCPGAESRFRRKQ
jgi:hypothetical protein